MIKTSLFADQEREAKLNKLGDALRLLEQHVNFAALAAEVDCAAHVPAVSVAAAHRSHRIDDPRAAGPAVVQPER
jgi:hypothetical protein